MQNLTFPVPTRGPVVVWGLLGNAPFGGMIWQVLHHLAGLRLLGFDTWYVQDTESPLADPMTMEPLWGPQADYSRLISLIAELMATLGMSDRWIVRPPGVYDDCFGALSYSGLQELYKRVDGVLNLCGATELREEHSFIQRLIYLETDPGGNQIAVAKGNTSVIRELDQYSYLFTYGENVGTQDFRIPVQRYKWHTTRPPVVIEWWVDCGAPTSRRFSTITNWRNEPRAIEWSGTVYRWQKAPEFLNFSNLPKLCNFPLELAVSNMKPNEASYMREAGWKISCADELSDWRTYRNFICESAGEFTVTKDLVRLSKSGWFSDRSACYLAAGRPVVMQDTGFGNKLPTGKGLFHFETETEAAVALNEVFQDYEGNRSAARGIAQEFFESRLVLSDVMKTSGLL